MEKQLVRIGFRERVKELLLGRHCLLDTVQVEVSSRCQGRCRYCPHTVFKDRWRPADMSADLFQRLWPLMRRAGRVHLQGWGEPLMHPRFFDLAAIARKAGCAVSTTSCGIGFDDRKAEEIVRNGIDIVAFSLVGTDDTSNAARAGLPFEQVCASVERLQAVRRARGGDHLEIHFAYLLLASEMESVRRLPALMQRLGVHAAVVSTLDYLPQSDLHEDAFLPHKHAERAMAAAILEETAAEARRLELGFHYRLADWDTPRPGCTENIGRSLFVSSAGDVSPCVFLNVPTAGADDRRRTFGDVSERDPWSVWEDPEYRTFRECLAHGRPDPLCLDCPKRFMT
jgi:MoaA/NifB/PqqE/SkfB family radical SAM enzyme